MLNQMFGITIPERFIVTYDDAMRFCTHCGGIEPRVVNGGFVPRECEHMRDERDRRQVQRAQERDAQKERDTRAQEAHSLTCYSWLGKDYSEKKLDEHDFETFLPKTAGQKKAKSDASIFAEARNGSLIFHGDCGTGKTHLACAIANAVRASGTPCLFTTGPNLFNAISDRMSENQGHQDILKKMYATPLLILDDVDKVPPTDFRKQIYFEVINKRTNRELPTIITTNLPIKRYATELAAVIGDAAASRLNVGLVLIGMSGTDHRLTQKGSER